MHSVLGSVLKQRLSVSGVLKWVILFGGLYLATGNASLVAGIGSAVVITEAVDVLEALPGVDERWVKAGFAVVFVALSGVGLWADLREPTSDGVVWPVAAIGVGLWLLLDTRADFVQGRRFGDPGPPDERDELSGREAMLLIQHAGLVADRLGEGPKTVPELAAACDLTESRVRDAIEIAGHDGTIYQVDEPAADEDAVEPRYALDDRKMGFSGFGRQAAGGLSGLARRVVRPFVSQFPQDTTGR